MLSWCVHYISMCVCDIYVIGIIIEIVVILITIFVLSYSILWYLLNKLLYAVVVHRCESDCAGNVANRICRQSSHHPNCSPPPRGWELQPVWIWCTPPSQLPATQGNSGLLVNVMWLLTIVLDLSDPGFRSLQLACTTHLQPWDLISRPANPRWNTKYHKISQNLWLSWTFINHP